MGVEQVTPWLEPLAQYGVAGVAVAVAFAVVVPLIAGIVKRNERIVDEVLRAGVDRIIHGDGNGQASLTSIQTTLGQHGERLTAVEAEVQRLQTEHAANHGKAVRLANGGGA